MSVSGGRRGRQCQHVELIVVGHRCQCTGFTCEYRTNRFGQTLRLRAFPHASGPSNAMYTGWVMAFGAAFFAVDFFAVVFFAVDFFFAADFFAGRFFDGLFPADCEQLKCPLRLISSMRSPLPIDAFVYVGHMNRSDHLWRPLCDPTSGRRTRAAAAAAMLRTN